MNLDSKEKAILLNALENRINFCATRAEDATDNPGYWKQEQEQSEALYDKVLSGQEGQHD